MIMNQLISISHGRGMHQNAYQELHFLDSTNDIQELTEGRLLCSIKDLSAINQLKTIEKCLLVVYWKKRTNSISADGIFVELESDLEKMKQALSSVDINTCLERWKIHFKHTFQQKFARGVKRKLEENHSTETDNRSSDDSTNSDTYRLSIKLTGLFRKLNDDKLKNSVNEIVKPYLPTNYKHDPQSQLTLSLFISNDLCIFGIPTSYEPLSYRPYLLTHGLRPTICAAVVKQAYLQYGEIVLDPFVGLGTLLIEAAVISRDCIYIGCDILRDVLRQARDNVMYSRTMNKDIENTTIEFIYADSVKGIPMLEGVIDVIITDIPFNKTHKIKSSLTKCHSKSDYINLITFYKNALARFYKLLKPNGRAIVLFPHNLHLELTEIFNECHFIIKSTQTVYLGLTPADITHLTKSVTSIQVQTAVT